MNDGTDNVGGVSCHRDLYGIVEDFEGMPSMIE
jgi:hypothetical protein